MIEVFQYLAGPRPPASKWEGIAEAWEEAEDEVMSAPDATLASNAGDTQHTDMDKALADEAHRSFEAGREQGIQEGRLAEHEELAVVRSAAEKRLAGQIAALTEGFAGERDKYLHVVEREVVKLALAIAARILRREAQMDPLLLTGAVRVALGQLSKTTKVRLRVPESELDLWTEAIALLPNLTLKPAVLSGESMRAGDCVVETELGSVDLGIRAQLAEIERGFFDRAGGNNSVFEASPDRPGEDKPAVQP